MEKNNYYKKPVFTCDKCGEIKRIGHYYEDVLYCNCCWKDFLDQLTWETIYEPEPDYE